MPDVGNTRHPGDSRDSQGVTVWHKDDSSLIVRSPIEKILAYLYGEEVKFKKALCGEASAECDQ